MRILIIRHGESEADILHVYEGRADFELTERGHKQAEAMSEYVKQNYEIDRIYCSPLKRTAQTAEYLRLKTNAPLFLEERLMEFNNGLIAGLKPDIAAEKYPKQEVPRHLSVYEQESALEFRFRGEYMLSKIIYESQENSTIAVVTHGGMISQLYRSFFGLPMERKFSFRTGDTGIHEWLIDGDTRSVIRANYLPHNL